MLFTSTPLSALTVLGLAIGNVLASPTPLEHPLGHQNATQHRNGAVASESKICSQIGADVLEKGGNAADSMVATVFCTGVIGMYHSGIGGGGFMLVRGPDGKYEFIDFRESAPAAMNETVYVGNVNGSLFTGLASGVPGEIRGMQHLHDKYGSLPWKDLIMPAVHVARYGFPVTTDLVNYINSSFTDGAGEFLINDPAWALDFAPNGTLLGLGEILTRKRYADTLETIAEKGPDAFYTGNIARTMIRALRSANGTMTLEDLKNYTVAVRDPVKIQYRNYTLHSSAAPASGAVALSALKILEGYKDAGQPSALNLSTHRLTEAFRFAYGERTELGDPSYVPGLVEYQANMLNDSTAARIRSKISDAHTWNVSYYDPSGLEIKNTPGTSHVVTADSAGLAVSLTTTVNLLFGSKLIVPETGIIMNNEMNDFSIPGVNNAFGFAPSPNNYVRGGARPLSSISPIIADDCDGNLVLVTGSAGGSRIITASTLQVWNVLDRGMTAAQALAEKRLHDQLVPDTTNMELGYDAGVVAFMKSRGHNVTQPGVAGSSTAQSIRVFRKQVGTQNVLGFEAASEPRQKNSGSFVV
ncbi:gamma-glutamyltranspeptidase [Myriangium duriaei CBS 260.36]|uniref:Glutathione hydrolase n=1 Tax=Myriangium duriaei CBS 260.36 TaxID=1168546 RepID=A0A9P4IWI6_9PEZI|nr:gamma-glutamyltranspeptidase [Myriangium duriaei CBS 260.36]